MRCLQCASEMSPQDKKRKSFGEFCSGECREKYFHESNQLAIQRLRQQWEINRTRPPEKAPTAPLPAPASADPMPCDFLPELTFLPSNRSAPPLPEPAWIEPQLSQLLPVSRFLTAELPAEFSNPMQAPEVQPLSSAPVATPALPLAVDDDHVITPAPEAPPVHTISGWWGKLRIAKPRPSSPAPPPPDPLLPAGPDSWRTEWTADSTGTPRARQLTLYIPARRLRDYVLEFEAEFDSQPLGWAMRVQDSSSYYCFKLTRTERGLRLIRFATIGGTEDRRFEVPVPDAPAGSSLVVRAEARGAVLTTYLNGRAVDAWADDRLARGPFGFVTEKNHRTAIRAVQVTFAVQPPFGAGRPRNTSG